MRSYYLCLFILISFVLSVDSQPWKKIQEKQLPVIKVIFELEKRHFDRNESIPLKITFQNVKNSPDLLQLRFTTNLYEHFILVVHDQNDLDLTAAEPYLIWEHQVFEKNSIGSAESQLVELAYLETYTTVIDLLDWFEFEITGIHFLKGAFIYNPWQKDNILEYRGNDVSFIIDESFLEKKEKKKISKKYSYYMTETSFDLREKMKSRNISRVIPPYEVVVDFLRNQQSQDWKEYFGALHLPEYLVNSYFTTDIYERHLSALESEKEIILADFKNFLIDSLDYEIESFEVLQTLIKKDTAEVVVGIKTKSSTLSYIKKMNPTNGQIEFSWIPNKSEFLKENKIFYFNLKKYYDQWRIVEKRIGSEKSQKFSYTKKYKPAIFGNILFYQGTTNVVEDTLFILSDLINYLRGNKKALVHLYGHTDDRGSEKANEVLSQNRAVTIKNGLVQAGIKPDSIYLHWYGEKKPIYDNFDEGKMTLNRRVEIKIENSFNN